MIRRLVRAIKGLWSKKEKSRVLASIQRIVELNPIEGADRIELARVMDWNVIVKKGEFKEGDKCVFFEIDSILPDGAPWAEFMRDKKFRVKAMKLRGVISCGLALPLSEFPELCQLDFKIGNDLTETLGVQKWEWEPPTSGGPNRVKQKAADTAGPFPHWLRKTDETRIQSCGGVIQEMAYVPYYMTLKYDGQSGTFAKYNGKLYVCSRGRELKEGDSNWWKIAKKLRLERTLPDGFAIQGEVCGPGIQRNLLMLRELELFVFNVWDIDKQCYLNYADLVRFCAKHGFKMVEVLETGDSFNYTVDELLKAAEGKYASGKHREGIVIRPQVEMYSKTLRGRMSFKAINMNYLLKYEA